MSLARIVFCAVLIILGLPLKGQEPVPGNPADVIREGQNQKKALRIVEGVYQAVGFGNTFMVTTSEGNVIIDTSLAAGAAHHVKLLKAENAGPIRYIILTHGHGDHTGGVGLWREPGTAIIAQRNHVEFMHYQARLHGFFGLRNAAQFALPRPAGREWPGNYGAKIEPSLLFDDRHEFNLGATKFELYHTPGETPDHLTVWLPQSKAAFIGDNYYQSFPNIYTLRGTQPRWALDYIHSLDKVLSLKPEVVLPSHGLPIHGNAEITRLLTRYRDAVQYVHDETVKGMNAGKDVFTLMREIKLPAALDVGESYGKLSWSIRGIYEGYAGWFDLNPVTMYEVPSSSVHADLVRLAGGAGAIVKLAMERVEGGRAVEALHLIEAALAADPDSRPALEVRLKALHFLRDRSRNSNERGWLDYSIGVTKGKLAGKQ